MSSESHHDQPSVNLSVSFLDLAAVNAPYMNQLEATASESIRSGWYIHGDSCRRFENEFADYCGVKHCIGVGNGLDALTLTLTAWRILNGYGPESQVIIPAHTFVATALAVVDSGLTPVFVDVDCDSFLIDVEAVRNAINKQTVAVIAVQLYGQPADMDELGALCQENGIKLLEDAAQAHGARYHGRRCGNLSDAAAFSFYPGKNLGALGDGGAVTTQDDQLAECVRSLGNYGCVSKYKNAYAGRNSRLDEIQAALLSVKLVHLDADNRQRRLLASMYLQGISNPLVSLPATEQDRDHVWHLFVVRVDDRNAFQAHMTAANIQTAVHYPIPPHRQQAFPEWHHLNLPITEQLHREVVSLPISPAHTVDEIKAVIAGVNSYAPPTNEPASSIEE